LGRHVLIRHDTARFGWARHVVDRHGTARHGSTVVDLKLKNIPCHWRSQLRKNYRVSGEARYVMSSHTTTFSHGRITLVFQRRRSITSYIPWSSRAIPAGFQHCAIFSSLKQPALHDASCSAVATQMACGARCSERDYACFATLQIVCCPKEGEGFSKQVL
jgi:hypothetical protein